MVVFRMRRLLLILMIALLPLRGWAGEMMAVSMAVQQLSVAVADQKSVAKAVEQAGSPTGAMPADCPMLGPLANNATDADVVGVHKPRCTSWRGGGIHPGSTKCLTRA